MSNLRKPFTIPPSRLVGGSLTDAKTMDAEGKPMVYKSGPKAGQPRSTYDFAAAVPKAAGQTHWGIKPADWDTNPATAGLPYWGEIVWNTGHGAFPQGQAQRPDFAWKITDGDSTIPNKRGKKPCDQEGYRGCWVLWFSSEYAPRTFNSNGTAPIDPATIKPGHFVQVAGTVDTNASDNQPGVYLNHSLVAHAGFGPEIYFGPDPTQAGFGRGGAPAGMSTTPVGGLPAATAAALPVPGAPAAAPLPAPTPTAAPLPSAAPAPAAAAPAPTGVAPAPGFLGAPAAPAPAAPAAPAPVPSGPTMTAKANGVPWASFAAQGWKEADARAQGFIV
jgi:hypothetical protein